MSVNVSTIEQTFQVCEDESVPETVSEVQEIDYGEFSNGEFEKSLSMLENSEFAGVFAFDRVELDKIYLKCLKTFACNKCVIGHFGGSPYMYINSEKDLFLNCGFAFDSDTFLGKMCEDEIVPKLDESGMNMKFRVEALQPLNVDFDGDEVKPSFPTRSHPQMRMGEMERDVILAELKNDQSPTDLTVAFALENPEFVVDVLKEYVESKKVSNVSELEESFVLSEYPLIQSKHKKDPTLVWTQEELEVKKCWSGIQSRKDKERIAAKKLSVTFATEPARPSETELDEMYIINEYPLIQSKHKKDPTLEWTEEELKVKKSWSELQSKNDRERLAAKKSSTGKKAIAKLVSPDSMSDQQLYQTTRLTEMINQKGYGKLNTKQIKTAKKFLDMIPHVFSTLSDLKREVKPLQDELNETKTQMETEMRAIRDKYTPVIDPLVKKISDISQRERVYRTSLNKVCFHDYGYLGDRDCCICHDINFFSYV